MEQKLSSRTRSGRLGKRLAAWSPPVEPPVEIVALKSSLTHQAVIVLIGLVIFFTNLGSAALFDMDEALYATCAREMVERGDLVVPWFNGQMFPDKPPLMFWLMMLGTELFGATELAVRFHSAVFGIGTALATYHLGRLLFRAEVGFWAGVIVSTSIIFTISARAATVDSALTFAITAAVLTFVATAPAWQTKRRQDKRLEEWSQFLPRRWPAFVLMYALIAMAVLAKGPVGLIMPIGALGLFLLMVDRLDMKTQADGPIMRGISRSGRWLADQVSALRMIVPWWLLRSVIGLHPVLAWWRRFTPPRMFRAGWRLRPLTALLAVGVIALPWYVLVGLRTEGRWLEGFMAMNMGPAVKPIQGHSGPWFYHLLTVFVGFFPWSVFIGPMLVEAVRRVRGGHPW
ncbi:MAG: glycosyltransferase family 39 protein, partial [Pirellulales bacterium]|nr:glycosyltransferase family 39 protein [Pirellulales bacterium]